MFQIATVERHQILRPDLILAHDHARNGDTVAIRFKRQIILHADQRHDEAQFARQLPPDAGNASHERRALAIIDKTDKAIDNLKQIGSAHVRTPAPNGHLVCRRLLEKKQFSNLITYTESPYTLSIKSEIRTQHTH